MRVLASVLSLCAACGPAADSRTTPAEARATTVELTVRDPRAGFVHVGDLRGQVVMLVFVSTFDGVSHAMLTELGRFSEAHPEVAFVGVMHQPGAEALADAFVNAMNPPFPLGFDPDGVIANGSTPIGEITVVPTMITLDRAGHVVSRRDGFQGDRVLEAMVLDADVRVPATEVTQPPLLGNPSAR